MYYIKLCLSENKTKYMKLHDFLSNMYNGKFWLAFSGIYDTFFWTPHEWIKVQGSVIKYRIQSSDHD